MKSRPNDPCPCGSGKKFKKCHGAPAAQPVARPAGAGSVAVLLAQARQLQDQGRLEDAERAIQLALQRAPGDADAWQALGDLAERVGDFETARACYARLVELHPGHAPGFFRLGNAQARLFAFAQAREAYRRAIALGPELPGVWGNLGNVEKYLGNFAEAIACYLRDIELETDPAERVRRHSYLLISLHYDERLSHDQLFEAHKAWADRYARPFYPTVAAWSNVRDPERPLRLGYVSGSFNGLIVGHLIESVLAHHDRERFRLTLYSSTARQDAKTARLRELADAWVEIGGLDDDAAAARIRDDAIDILVDLDGHSPTGRPLLFARKPAPVQVEWLDYFDTSGLETIDFILTDPYTTPVDSPQRFSETPWRLPHTRFCYTPPDYAPPVAEPPCLAGRPFTFGSFNRQDKLNPALLGTWAEILGAVPGARLLLKNRGLDVAAVRASVLETFGKAGIGPDRLVLRGASPHAGMLAEYGEVDVALDTFPYNGGLTSCECLWMGVPIVALEAERMIGRQSAAMLRLLGLDDWVAGSPADYVRLAVEKSRLPAALAPLRGALRDRMAASPLCDAGRFARDLEGAFRTLWRNHCAAGPVAGAGNP
jgi:predicted O-linked N-acetylglucosamine transferase (SPINDLY family)